MKKRFGTILVVICMFGLIACGYTDSNDSSGNDSNLYNIDKVIESPNSNLVDFELVDNNFSAAILVDKNTNVMYYWFTRSGASGITPIYNADGTLKLYEEH